VLRLFVLSGCINKEVIHANFLRVIGTDLVYRFYHR
jgi:hypothetical protein